MTLYVSNAFSLNMLVFTREYNNYTEIKLTSDTVYTTFMKTKDVKKLLNENDFISVVGHESTAKIMSEILGINIEFNRVPIKLEKGDVLIVFQLFNRLPEGKVLTKEEIDNLNYAFFKVEVM